MSNPRYRTCPHSGRKTFLTYCEKCGSIIDEPGRVSGATKCKPCRKGKRKKKRETWNDLLAQPPTSDQPDHPQASLFDQPAHVYTDEECARNAGIDELSQNPPNNPVPPDAMPFEERLAELRAHWIAEGQIPGEHKVKGQWRSCWKMPGHPTPKNWRPVELTEEEKAILYPF